MQSKQSPREVFQALVEGICAGRWEEVLDLYADDTIVIHPFDPRRAPALRSREAIREHFLPGGRWPEQAPNRVPVIQVVHETSDPEVVVAEFEYRGTTTTNESFSTPCIFVLRVRNGQIVESRDYIDHAASARSWGRLDEYIAATREIGSVAR